jgi:hypothetical protein
VQGLGLGGRFQARCSEVGVMRIEFRDECSSSNVKGSGFRAYGFGFKVLGCRVQELRIRM